jgi:hypothetical protein
VLLSLGLGVDNRNPVRRDTFPPTAHPSPALAGSFNHRLNNQNRRIHQEVKEGELSKQQAAGLHAQDRNVRQEERAMARNDNGHITKADKRALNQQENGISKEIGQ